MAKSSFNLTKALIGGLKHNDRTEGIEPGYLLDEIFREGNEIDFSAIEAQKKIDILYEEAQKNHLKTFNQKLQARSFFQEAVVNLNKNHGLKEVRKLISKLEKETGFTCTQIAIHADEGRVEKDKNGEEIAVHNYHAHLTFFTLDRQTGQQLYRKDIPKSLRIKYRKEIEAPFALKPTENIIKPLKAVSKKKKKLWHINDPVTNKEIIKRFKSDGYIIYDRFRMSFLQTITAEELQMERGTVSVKEEADRLGVEIDPDPAVRQNHKQYRITIRKLEALEKEKKKIEENLERVRSLLKEEKEKNDLLAKDFKMNSEKLTEIEETLNSLKVQLPKDNEIIISQVLIEEIQKLKERFKIKSDIGLFNVIVEKSNDDQRSISELEKQLKEKNKSLKKKEDQLKQIQEKIPKEGEVIIDQVIYESKMSMIEDKIRQIDDLKLEVFSNLDEEKNGEKTGNKLSYKSVAKNMDKKIKEKDKKLEEYKKKIEDVKEILYVVKDHNVSKEALSGTIEEIKMKVVGKIWSKNEDHSLNENQNLMQAQKNTM